MGTHEDCGESSARARRVDRDLLLKGWRIELLKFFRRKVAPDDVEDLAQQAWAVMASVDAARIQTTFRAYMRGVARNVLYSHYREMKRHGDFDPHVDRMVALVPTVTQVLAKRQDVQRIERRLQRLPVELQLLFEGHFVDGMTGVELAEVFGLPEGTVRSRLARVRRVLDEVPD